MSDYTPTTEEVRGAYSMGEPDEINAFDRWLYKEYAEHVDIGYAIAVAEIIKLLEALADITTNHQHKLGVLEAVDCIKFNANHAALIKGENK